MSKDREEFLLARLAEIQEELDALRQSDPPDRRDYVVGLPVAVTIDDTGWITADVDLSELSEGVRKDDNAGPLGKYWEVHYEGAQTQAATDSVALGAWAQKYSLRNEGHL